MRSFTNFLWKGKEAFTKDMYDVKKRINRRKIEGICFCIVLYIDVFHLGFYGIIQLTVSRIKITKVHWRKGGYCE